MSEIWLDGRVTSMPAPVSIYTHSLQYGYGVIEGIRAYDVDGQARMFAAREHFERLHASADLLNLRLDFSVDELITGAQDLLNKINLREAYVRPVVYLGDGLGNLRDPRPVHVAIIAWEWTSGSEAARSMRLTLAPFRRPNPEHFPSAAKSTGSYMMLKTATLWAQGRGYDDAIVRDHDGLVSEATAQNIFAVKDGAQHTVRR